MTKRTTREPNRRGRGATLDPTNRYHVFVTETLDDDGWHRESPAPPATTLRKDRSRRVITFNNSPDVPFDRSINPYRGCEHGCVYCFARPSHAYLDLSPGLDFEQKLFWKPDAAEQLRDELSRPKYRPQTIALGVNTDAYQPVERRTRLTRKLLDVLDEFSHPVSIVTKSALVERDIDRLASMAARGLASVAISITTLDAALARNMEPRAAAPHRRLETVRRLSAAGIPVHLMVAPLIPALNDSELEGILAQGREAGATSASYVLLRLPLEVAPMFEDWLQKSYPDRASHVLQRVRDCRGGKLYDSRFGERFKGSGVFAELMSRRFELATRRLEYQPIAPLRNDLFAPPGQLSLFD